MKTALVTAIGSFSADIVIKNLKKKGFRVIGCDIYRKELVADAYNVNEFYQAPLAVDVQQYIDFIKDICNREKVEYVLPLTDVEVDTLNDNRDWFAGNEICVCISPESTIDICRNKKNFADFTQKLKFANAIPAEYVAELSTEPSAFPVVCKPYNGRSSRGLRYIESLEEWKEFVLTKDANDCIVQPFVKGRVITVDVVRHPETNTSTAICRAEMLRTQNGAGTSVYVFADDELEQCSKKLAEALGVIGCVNFEFIKDAAGKYHLMECNPRFSGGVEFSCIAGYDFVWNHLRCFCDDSIESAVRFHNMYIARKYEEYITKIE